MGKRKPTPDEVAKAKCFAEHDDRTMMQHPEWWGAYPLLPLSRPHIGTMEQLGLMLGFDGFQTTVFLTVVDLLKTWGNTWEEVVANPDLPRTQYPTLDALLADGWRPEKAYDPLTDEQAKAKCFAERDDRTLMQHPDWWPRKPYLMLCRPSDTEDDGTEVGFLMGAKGCETTVFLENVFLVEQKWDANNGPEQVYLNIPRITYPTLDDLLAAGWRID